MDRNDYDEADLLVSFSCHYLLLYQQSSKQKNKTICTDDVNVKKKAIKWGKKAI